MPEIPKNAILNEGSYDKTYYLEFFNIDIYLSKHF